MEKKQLNGNRTKSGRRKLACGIRLDVFVCVGMCVSVCVRVWGMCVCVGFMKRDACVTMVASSMTL